MSEKRDTRPVETETPGPADTEAQNPAETVASDPAAIEAPDPFDPENLRISQDFTELAGVKQIRATVPVRKPGTQDFFRIHPSADYQLTTAILRLKDEREDYLVAPELRQELFGEIVPVTLFTGVTRQSVLFLWPCRLPDETGRSNAWWESALEAVELAREKWVRISPDMNLAAYRIFVAREQLSEPDWPEESLGELLKTAFKSRLIDSIDHPVLKRLRGEA